MVLSHDQTTPTDVAAAWRGIILDMAATPGIRAEVEEQKLLDLRRGDRQSLIMARMGATVEAMRLVKLHESAATPALRQALIDLASVSELLASELPAPSLAQEAA